MSARNWLDDFGEKPVGPRSPRSRPQQDSSPHGVFEFGDVAIGDFGEEPRHD